MIRPGLSTMELTRILAQFVHDAKFDNMPADAVEKGKECFLDWHGVSLAGTTDPAAEIIIQYVLEAGGTAQASVLGTGIKTNIANAALANGLIGHALDFDDYHDDTVIHASAACLPAILAVAENRKMNGEDLLTAMIVGIDVAIRVGLSLGDYHYQRGWHSTSTAGIFGATAGVAKLLHLDVEKIINAFGICGTQSSGLRQVFGTMTKPFHAGKISMEGVISAFLAEKGFTSSKKIIEGDLGLLEVLTEYANEDFIVNELGAKYYIMDLSIKPYPT